ncbi:UNVERIFIED_CONTAM: hypothetical protein K2H54_043623 [Gekko kuhli]
METLLDEEVMDINMQEEYMDLPEQGQQWILDRIECLKQKLINYNSHRQQKTFEVDVVVHEKPECNSLTATPPKQSPTEDSPETMQVLAPIDDAQPLFIGHSPNLVLGLASEPSNKSVKNDCIYPDANKSLEHLTEAD